MQKVAHVEHLDGIWLEMAQNGTETPHSGHSGLFNQPLRGVGGQVVAQNPRKGFGPSRAHQPTPSGGWAHFSKVIQIRAKMYYWTGRGNHFFPSTNPCEGLGLFNRPLRRVGGPKAATPTAEGGGGEVNLPPESLLLRCLTRRTEGRRIFMLWATHLN